MPNSKIKLLSIIILSCFAQSLCLIVEPPNPSTQPLELIFTNTKLYFSAQNNTRDWKIIFQFKYGPGSPNQPKENNSYAMRNFNISVGPHKVIFSRPPLVLRENLIKSWSLNDLRIKSSSNNKSLVCEYIKVSKMCFYVNVHTSEDVEWSLSTYFLRGALVPRLQGAIDNICMVVLPFEVCFDQQPSKSLNENIQWYINTLEFTV